MGQVHPQTPAVAIRPQCARAPPRLAGFPQVAVRAAGASEWLVIDDLERLDGILAKGWLRPLPRDAPHADATARCRRSDCSRARRGGFRARARASPRPRARRPLRCRPRNKGCRPGRRLPDPCHCSPTHMARSPDCFSLMPISRLTRSCWRPRPRFVGRHLRMPCGNRPARELIVGLRPTAGFAVRRWRVAMPLAMILS